MKTLDWQKLMKTRLLPYSLRILNASKSNRRPLYSNNPIRSNDSDDVNLKFAPFSFTWDTFLP